MDAIATQDMYPIQIPGVTMAGEELKNSINTLDVAIRSLCVQWRLNPGFVGHNRFSGKNAG
jgi:hypothetical protein